MLSLGILRICIEEKIRFWNNKKFTITPTIVSWKVKNDGIVITPFHKTILIMRVNIENILYFNGILTTSLDGYFSGVVGKNMKIKHIKTSEDFFAVSLENDSRSDSSIGGLSRTYWGDYDKQKSMRDLLIGKVSKTQRQFSLIPYELKTKKTINAEMTKTKILAKKTLTKLMNKYNFDHFEYSNHYNTKGFQNIPNIDLKMFDNIKNIKRVMRQPVKKFSFLKTFVENANFFLRGSNYNLNGLFENWTSTKFKIVKGAWSKLPVKNWLGHFELDSGFVNRSYNVPDKKTRYSLKIIGFKKK